MQKFNVMATDSISNEVFGVPELLTENEYELYMVEDSVFECVNEQGNNARIYDLEFIINNFFFLDDDEPECITKAKRELLNKNNRKHKENNNVTYEGIAKEDISGDGDYNIVSLTKGLTYVIAEEDDETYSFYDDDGVLNTGYDAEITYYDFEFKDGMPKEVLRFANETKQ